MPTPDREPLQIKGGDGLPLTWRAHLTAAAIGSVDLQARASAEALGFSVVLLPETPGDMPPSELLELLGIGQ